MRLIYSLACALALVLGAVVAQAADGGVSVELNKLEAQDGACRAYLVLQNRGESAFETLELDLVMFDGDGVIAKRLAVEMAPLPADKTRVKVFDIQGLSCNGIGRILLNDILACADGSGALDDCLGRVSVSSRETVPFIE